MALGRAETLRPLKRSASWCLCRVELEDGADSLLHGNKAMADGGRLHFRAATETELYRTGGLALHRVAVPAAAWSPNGR